MTDLLDSRTTEYIYGRVRVLNRIVDRFLKGDERIFRPVDDESQEAILYAYAKSRVEAEEFARDVLDLGTTLTEMGRDLQRFVKEHKTEKWSD